MASSMLIMQMFRHLPCHKSTGNKNGKLKSSQMRKSVEQNFQKKRANLFVQ